MLAAGAVVTTAVAGSLVLQDAHPASADVGPNDPNAHFLLITAQDQPVWSVDGYLNADGQRIHHWYEQHSSFSQRTLWYWQYSAGQASIDINLHHYSGTDDFHLLDLSKNYCLKVDYLGEPLGKPTTDGCNAN
jgi:hypothetical protein